MLLGQATAENLPGRVAGNLVDLVDLLRDLVAGKPRARMDPQLVRIGVSHDEGWDRLAPPGARPPYHRGIADRRMAEQDLLHLGGGHVLAAGHDRVADA